MPAADTDRCPGWRSKSNAALIGMCLLCERMQGHEQNGPSVVWLVPALVWDRGEPSCVNKRPVEA